MKKTSRLIRNDIILAVFVALAALGSYFYMAFSKNHESDRVEIYSDGQLVLAFSLSVDGEYAVADKDFAVEVKDKKIRVSKTHCKDRVCETMEMNDSGGEIICLPNKIVVKFSEQKENSADIVAG